MPTVTARTLEARIKGLIRDGAEFSSDDVTDDGKLTLDASHAPNAKQSGIGMIFRDLQRRGLIEWTGRCVNAKAPHRHSGLNRVWQGTGFGREWAAT